jgi:hypothetical protein
VCDSVCIEPVVVQHVVRREECSGRGCRWLVESKRRGWRRWCCCCSSCCPYCSSQSIVQRLDGIGDNEHECAFVVLVAAYPDGVGLGCSYRVVNGRRWWWVVHTPCCVVQMGLNSERGGMHNLVCANLVVTLFAVLSKGSRRWGVLTRWYLHFSCFSFQLSYLPLFPHLPLLTLPIVLVRCPRPLVGLVWV